MTTMRDNIRRTTVHLTWEHGQHPEFQGKRVEIVSFINEDTVFVEFFDGEILEERFVFTTHGARQLALAFLRNLEEEV